MIFAKNLPSIRFINADNSEKVLHLSQQAGRIRGISRHLQASFSRGAAVGLMYRSEPNLVVNWLACIDAGLEPLIMQYPTKKQSAAYWSDSVRNTVEVANLSAIIADNHCAALGLGKFAKVCAQREFDGLPLGSNEPWNAKDFAILQLSSGTTGYRKGVRFNSIDLARHVEDYNRTLALAAGDKIISWLPLYHDMGYIACFVMPLILGIDIVMIDPMTWVAEPELLFQAVSKHAGTVCYMPNFSFELMSRCSARPMPRMRWWISCSEPISATSARKFMNAIGANEETFGSCYAMAENVFAVSIRKGIETRTIGGADVVSCGKPINDLEVKIVDQQIWVRSPTSIRAYIGLDDIRDEDGFYATGDLGEIHDGEIYVTGRKQDLIIQAGKKFFLSDIDLRVNELYPHIKGRAAAVSVYDHRLATEQPVVLIEARNFFEQTNGAKIAATLKSAIGLDHISVEFVPPRFLTKTSSGKFNRKKSAEHWALHRDAIGTKRGLATDPIAELQQSFKDVSWSLPVANVLDSLSTTVLRIILSETAVTYDSAMTLERIAKRLSRSLPAPQAAASDGIAIVSLADRTLLHAITEQHLDRLSKHFGCPVTLEHICLPPSPIVLSDLIFHDYFQLRLEQEPFSAVNRAFSKLKTASVILTDDIAEMFFPPQQVYGVLSHNLERDPRADLVAVRWQRYAQSHHQLPLTVVAGADLPLEYRSGTLEQLSAYLATPIFRIAAVEGFSQLTQDWEFRPLLGASGYATGLAKLDSEAFLSALTGFIDRHGDRIKRQPVNLNNRLNASDLAHFCSHYADRLRVDKLLTKFNSFCIAGQASSVPYIRNRLDALGKPYRIVPSYSPEILDSLSDKFECLLVCGSQLREHNTKLPTAAIMRVGKLKTCNIEDSELKNKTFWTLPKDAPVSQSDWFYAFPMKRMRKQQQFEEVRNASRQAIRAWRGAGKQKAQEALDDALLA